MTATEDPAILPDFCLDGPYGSLLAAGERATLPAGRLDSLAERVRAFFASHAEARTVPLVGAIPFDPLADDHLFLPERTSTGHPFAPDAARIRLRGLSIRPEPEAARFADAVAHVRDAIVRSSAGGGGLAKVVLARSLAMDVEYPVDLAALLARLHGDPDITRFLTPLPPAGGAPHGSPSRHLVGATPELLVSRRGDRVFSFPLAGSEPRDRSDGSRLLASRKERWEHRLVVEAIADVLAPHCAQLSVPHEPELTHTRTMWHLGTRIEGRLARPEDLSAAALAAMLHPTPAVGGVPRDEALAMIRQMEPVDRGFYAGAVGWTDHAGDGDWFVSLRCAEVKGAQVRFHAGAGIVAGSDPQAELAETSAKFLAMLDAFGVEEPADIQPERKSA